MMIKKLISIDSLTISSSAPGENAHEFSTDFDEKECLFYSC